MEDFGFYLVMTEPKVGYVACAEAAVKAGVKMLQLRVKDYMPRKQALIVARQVREVTRGTATTFIVNDDPVLAVEVAADGVHVGQDDMRVEEVRTRFPALKIVGLSTHNLQQVQSAAAAQGLARPDYIGVGPVYATPTKKIPDSTLGPTRAGEMIAASPYPAVAIGGVNLETITAIKEAGARNFAVVRPVCGALDPYAAICALQKKFAEA